MGICRRILAQLNIIVYAMIDECIGAAISGEPSNITVSTNSGQANTGQ